MATESRIGTKIRRARERIRPRMTQGQLAKLLGVSRSAVNAWENDRMYPQGSIGALEEVLGISFDDQDEPEVRASEDAAQALDRAQHEIDQLRRLILNQRREGKGNEAKFRAV